MKEQAAEHLQDFSHLPEGVILPKHLPWFHRFQKESTEVSIEELFTRNSSSYEYYRNNAKPESDPTDIFRQEVKRPLNFSRREAVENAKQRLTTTLEKDIQAVLEEHQKLEYQSRIWPLNSANPIENWPGLGHHSETKAVTFLHHSKNYAEWKVNFIRYLRYRWENQQADELQSFLDTYQETKLQTPILSQELLGGHTVAILDSLGIPYISANKSASIDEGKLHKLGLKGDETVMVSPKFYLAMPDNPFVHAGNRSYVNLYQVVSVQRKDSSSWEQFLLADFYYAPLSLEELKKICEQFLPNSPIAKRTEATEQLILETTGIMPASFTNKAPFKLFLQMANSLGRDVALPFVQGQAKNHEFVKNQKANVRKGAAVFSQILLTEYALAQYFPQRQNYVSEILYRTFDVVLIAILTGQDLTTEKSQRILSEYRRTLVLEVEKLQEKDVDWNTYSVKREKVNSAEQINSFFHQKDIHYKQQEATWNNRELIEKGNLFAMALEPFIRGAATGIPSCASCLLGAAGKLGGVKPLPPGSMSPASSTGTSGFSGGSNGIPFSLSGYSGGSAQPWNGPRHSGDLVDSFLRRGYGSAQDAASGFRSLFISPNELLSYMMIGDRALANR